MRHAPAHGLQARDSGVRTSRHGAHLIQLTKYPVAFPMNCYVVVEEDGLTLVDSTMSSPADDLAALVKQLVKELRRVALTHAQGTHVSVDTMDRGLDSVDGHIDYLASVGDALGLSPASLS
jgi:glyoxylase-like metal-dependent hydrolase (beta-lactamase superfamily II)